MRLDCLEGFYGGAAAGGKSSALLMAALQYVHVPGYAALILRRTYADLALPGAIMDRSQEWLRGTGANWNDKTKTWTFPSSATLTFGYLENDADRFRYQGAEFQYISPDEVTQFSELVYRYLFSRLRRRKAIEVPLRMRSAGNPGGKGHAWVKARFGLGRDGSAARRIDGSPVLWTPESRAFVPSLVADNPGVDQSEYERSLAELDLTTRKQLESGDWDALPEGMLFKREWFTGTITEPRIVPLSAVPRTARRCWYWDTAATVPHDGNKDPDYTAGALCAYDKASGLFYVCKVVRFRKLPGDVKARIASYSETTGRGVAVRIEEEPGGSGKSDVASYVRDLAGFDVAGVRKTGSKEVLARPLAAQAQAGNVRLVAGDWHGDFLDEMEAFPTQGVHDDQVDAASGAFAVLTERRSGKVGSA